MNKTVAITERGSSEAKQNYIKLKPYLSAQMELVTKRKTRTYNYTRKAKNSSTLKILTITQEKQKIHVNLKFLVISRNIKNKN